MLYFYMWLFILLRLTSHFLCVFFVCFSKPTSIPGILLGRVHGCTPHLRGWPAEWALNNFPSLCYPWYMKVQPGAQSKPIIWETWLQIPPIWGHNIRTSQKRYLECCRMRTERCRSILNFQKSKQNVIFSTIFLFTNFT